MNDVRYVGIMSMMNSLSKETHLSVHESFNSCIVENMPEETRKEIDYYDTYFPLFERLRKANMAISPMIMINKRDLHINESDKYYRIIKQNVSSRVKEDEDDSVISDAKVVYNIVVNYTSVPKKAIKEKITQYRKFVKELSVKTNELNVLNIKHLIERLGSEIEKAELARIEVSNIELSNKENCLKDIRPEIDAAYRNTIDYLNSKWAIKNEKFECKEFMNEWAEVVVEFKNQYAAAKGLRKSIIIKNTGNSEENIENEDAEELTEDKDIKYYTLPKSRNVRFVDVNVGRTMEEGEEINIEPYPDAREWTKMVDVDEFMLGDICFVIVDGEKKYYKMIDESNFNIDPSGDEGSAGWEEL